MQQVDCANSELWLKSHDISICQKWMIIKRLNCCEIQNGGIFCMKGKTLKISAILNLEKIQCMRQ